MVSSGSLYVSKGIIIVLIATLKVFVDVPVLHQIATDIILIRRITLSTLALFLVSQLNEFFQLSFVIKFKDPLRG